MENMLYQGHRFLGGIKHFWMPVRLWKTNLVLEDLARISSAWPEKVTYCFGHNTTHLSPTDLTNKFTAWIPESKSSWRTYDNAVQHAKY